MKAETSNESSQTLATPVTDSSRVPRTHTLPAITQMLKNLPLLSILQMNKEIEEKNAERSRKTFNHSESFDPVVHTQPGSDEAKGAPAIECRTYTRLVSPAEGPKKKKWRS